MVGDTVSVGLFEVSRGGCLGGLERMLCLIVVGPFFGIFGPHPSIGVGSRPSLR